MMDTFDITKILVTIYFPVKNMLMEPAYPYETTDRAGFIRSLETGVQPKVAELQKTIQGHRLRRGIIFVDEFFAPLGARCAP
jgi:hypothetical protein